jgi:carbon-monoxide dehydrogenase medium subunit
MIPASFDYHAPGTVEEAVALLSKHGPDAKVLAGGHSLLPAMKLRLATPKVVVDLGRIPGLDGIRPEGGGLAIGALATHAAIQGSELVKRVAPLLARVAGEIGDVQVRNLGTLVGSLCHADPAADWPAALLALDAQAVVVGPGGERSLPVSDLITGMLSTALSPDEIVREVRIPRPHPGSSAYVKIAQSASGFAICGVAAQLVIEGGRAREIAVGVTGIADRAFRARGLEDALRGKPITSEAVAAAAAGLARGLELLSDLHASAEYRAHLAEICARRAILAAAEGRT